MRPPGTRVLRAPATVRSTDVATVVDGRRRRYRLHVPAVTAAGVTPLLVLLHHGRGDPESIEQLTGIVPTATARGFVVLIPEAVRSAGYWNDGRYDDIDDVAFLARAVREVRVELALDRVGPHLMGFSNGASMALLAAVTMPEPVAGVAAVAGTLARGLARFVRPPRPVPLIYFHGTQDPFAYYYLGGSNGTRPGASLSVPELAQWWGRRNRCGPPAVEWLPRRSSDGTRVVRTMYRSSRPAGSVLVYSILGGGHTWPSAPGWSPPMLGRVSSQVDATTLSCDFFLDHPWRHDGGEPRR